MENSYRICISSPPDREKLVAEIFFSDSQWAELNQEGSELKIDFYSRPDGKAWNLSLAVVEEAIKSARERLLG